MNIEFDGKEIIIHRRNYALVIPSSSGITLVCTIQWDFMEINPLKGHLLHLFYSKVQDESFLFSPSTTLFICDFMTSFCSYFHFPK